MGTSLVVQWLKLWASTAGDTVLVPGQGAKILHAAQCSQKQKEKEKKSYVVTSLFEL